MPASTRADTAEGTQLIADNRKARHDYHVFGTYEAGMTSAALARGLSQLAMDWPRRHHVEPWLVETQGLNLPPERYSLEVRRRVAEAAASRSFDEALFDLSRSTGAEVPKRQAEQLVARAAEDFDAFYEVRRATAGEPPPEGSHAPERRSDCRQDGDSGADDRLRRNRVGASPLRAPPPGFPALNRKLTAAGIQMPHQRDALAQYAQTRRPRRRPRRIDGAGTG